MKTACGDLQLCAGLKAGIEGATHNVGQRRVERVLAQRAEEEVEDDAAAEGQEEDTEKVARLQMNNLTLETAGAEEEVAEGLEAALEMEVEERGREGEEGGGGNQQALESLEFLTQESEPSGTMIVDSRNGFKELSRLAMLWTVRHRWSSGAIFAFNCYKHWTQLLLRHPGKLPVTILSR